MRNWQLHCLVSIALCASLLGCNSLIPGSYRGEEVLALRATIENHSSRERDEQQGLGDIEIYLVWSSFTGKEGPDGGMDEGKMATFGFGQLFPTSFLLRLYLYPPADPDSPDALRLSVGHFIAAPGPWAITPIKSHPTSQSGYALGADPHHVVYYLPDGVATGSPEADFLHTTDLAPGFYVFELKCLGPERKAEIAACIAGHPPLSNDEVGETRRARLQRECGLASPDDDWLELSPDGLETVLSVWLMDDVKGYQPDPATCLGPTTP